MAAFTSTLLLALSSLALATTVVPQGDPDDPVIPAVQQQGEYYVLNFSEDPKETVSLEDFVKLCQVATGKNFTYDKQVASELSAQDVRMFGTKRIPVDDFYQFFQIMMFINDFVTVEVGPRHLSVVVLQSLAGPNQQRNSIRQRTTYVLPEELEDFADQPAVLITTVLHLPNSNTRQLPATLRPLMADATTQSLVSVGDSNSIILQGFGSQIAALARLLYIVDRESAAGEQIVPEFATIPVEYESAEEIADILDQLLSARTTAPTTRPNEQGVAGNIRSRGTEQEPEILVHNRTNSLIIMAMPDDMPGIKELVARLDVDVIEPERNYHIFALENVQAEDISDVLDDFLRDASQVTEGATGGRAQGGAGAASSRNQTEVVVVPDPATNSLLIAASKTRYEELLALLRQLDRRQDQVLIETALIELSGADTLDIGFEIAAADIPAAGADGNFGVTSFGLSELMDLQGSDGIPDTRVPTIANGITAGILDGGDFSLPFLLRFAASEDKANVLSIPSILVNNNGNARVRTVDEQPTTQVTAQGQGQTQENFSGYQEAGIELSISPSISASRYLRLGVQLTVSNFTGAFQGNVPPPRTTRELSTTVNVPDGDTMVIGGIVTDNKRTSANKVPFLGDIPLIGWLFRRETDNNDRTTLYFFVTPHIMHDVDFADLSEISFRAKHEAASVIGLDRVQKIDQSFGSGRDGINLGSFELPLYRGPEKGEIDGESVGMDPMRREALLRAESEAANRTGGAPSSDGDRE